MAKHLYSPELESVWKGVEELIDQDEFTPDVIEAAHKAIAQLQSRDQAIEGSLLGDLVVNSVAGSAGSITPPEGKQIGWLMSTGTINGVADADGNFQIVYTHPFPIDTVVGMYFSLVSDPIMFFGIGPQAIQGSFTRFGFTVAIGAVGDPAHGCYLAIGF